MISDLTAWMLQPETQDSSIKSSLYTAECWP